MTGKGLDLSNLMLLMVFELQRMQPTVTIW